ncbi:response regulator transcription factor [Eubacteriales bacterium OttesenSCG-928-A19]|nr:response regulator transcription factor [Eubacteriales bacterium OttesenSCG-928-A19]
MQKILIIEDDPNIAGLERDFLEINGFQTEIASDGHEGLQLALSGAHDLILLDVMLPGIDGMEICRRIRPKLDTPILMVTARSEEVDLIRGLGLGADDYITKPFSPTQLVARVRANLAQVARLKGSVSPEAGQSGITIGRITLNPSTRRVFVEGREVELKHREYELLYFLMSNPEIVFSKEQLYERIWGMDALGDSKTVAVHINRLREKLEKDPANPVYIQTVWGAGYRMGV